MSHCDVILNAAGFTNTTPAHNQPLSSNARRHPHVTSRLHLRILNEQQLFNLEAYNNVHDKLRRISSKCGQEHNRGKSLPHRSVCSRTYEEVGPLETRLEFSDSHHGEAEWAYAPFLSQSAALNAAGPLDHVPVPVNRVNCSAQASYNSTNLPVLEPALLNVRANWNELGHRFHVDSHPRRRLIAYILGSLSGVFAFLLHIVYFWRLVSTVGISIRGQWLSIAGYLAWTVKQMFKSSDYAQKIVQGCFNILLFVIPLSAITRMEFSWRGFTRLPATFAHASHAERASSRIDAKSSWRFIGTSTLILAMCLFLANPFQRDLIPSSLPPDPEATVPSTTDNMFFASVTAALCLAGVLQLLMNRRARAFGAMYKATAWLLLAEQVFHFIIYLPAIFGHIPDRESLSLGEVIIVLPILVQAWQAWTLPSAKIEDEEHEN
ncbi:hypothetical protein GGX14DRAFT_652677 [Mycena pura]|uniref:Uncharacterized protein n=1 Tax=Mycena pura TaxID=153505 RepID=A0AAD6Y942_9AGAR|nr:hypothetical protein GGX14DRAFT_652677 [Mycena pura]